jgi:RND superfamily putative drug exporter
VIAALTLLPALLSLLGTRINSVRVLPRRMIGGDASHGLWARWSRVVTRRPAIVATVGGLIVVVLLIPASQLNPGDALSKDKPGAGPAITGRDTLTTAASARVRSTRS